MLAPDLLSCLSRANIWKTVISSLSQDFSGIQNPCFHRSSVTESGSWHTGFAKSSKGTQLALHMPELITWSWAVTRSFKNAYGTNGKNSKVDFINNTMRWPPSWISNKLASYYSQIKHFLLNAIHDYVANNLSIILV